MHIQKRVVNFPKKDSNMETKNTYSMCNDQFDFKIHIVSGKMSSQLSRPCYPQQIKLLFTLLAQNEEN